jgi:UPF0716 protein FxsA
MAFLWQGFFILAIAEVLVFYGLIGHVGFLETMTLWLVAGFAGLWLVKEQGTAAFLRLAAARGTLRLEDLQDGMRLLIAGLLFMFPGVVSDALALFFLIPALKGFRRAGQDAPVSRQNDARDDSVIEGEYEVVSEQPAALIKEQPETRDDGQKSHKI